MTCYKIIYKKYGKYSAIIYPVSYLSPFEEIDQLSKELKNNLRCGDCVLFDLLLSNGDTFNRFAEYYFDGNELKISSVNVTEVSNEELKTLNMYYRGKVKELSNSVLSAKERYKFATIK